MSKENDKKEDKKENPYVEPGETISRSRPDQASEKSSERVTGKRGKKDEDRKRGKE